MKLHLGCGTRRLPGYTHIDAREEVGPDIAADVTSLSMICDNSVEVVYACHVLEHIADAYQALGEWKRVLKPGATLRLSVPDFGAISDLYVNHRVMLMRLWGLLYGGQTYLENTHHICYDYESLAYALMNTGFYDIHRWNPEWELPEGYDDFSLAKINDRSVSLNVEALAK